MTESVPEALAGHVWARHQTGESCERITLWLAQIGYTVTPDEVPIIAFHYEHDTAQGQPRSSEFSAPG